MKAITKAVITLLVMAYSVAVFAQVSVNVNIQSQPLWGPVGYDYVSYYYLPQYDVYYNVPARKYVYLDGGQWIFAAALPPRFVNVDLYTTYKVVLTEPRAYIYHKDHVVKYVKYKNGGAKQVVIRNSDDPKYYIVKGHQKNSTPARVVKGTPAVYKSPAYKAAPAPHMQKYDGRGEGHRGGHGGGGKAKGKH